MKIVRKADADIVAQAKKFEKDINNLVGAINKMEGELKRGNFPDADKEKVGAILERASMLAGNLMDDIDDLMRDYL